MRVKQHLVPLARVGHQPERPARAQLHLRNHQLPVQPADHQRLLAPVKLERLAHLERQRHERLAARRVALADLPRPNEVRQLRVAARVALRLELQVQRLGRAPIPLAPVRVHLQRLRQRLHKRRQLHRHRTPPVLRLRPPRRSQPLLDRIPRQARQPRYLADRLAVPLEHPPNLANHCHGEHLQFPCYKMQQARSFTLVNFQPETPPSHGQFSSGRNNPRGSERC